MLPSEEATEVVKDRQEKYDHPTVVYNRVALIWSAILGQPVKAYQVALCLAGLKLGREAGRHHWDNLVDLAGYANVCGMIVERNAPDDPFDAR